jgi:hypothetical protein
VAAIPESQPHRARDLLDFLGLHSNENSVEINAFLRLIEAISVIPAKAGISVSQYTRA